MKLISLNLEGGKHIDKNLPWLKEIAPDVACFQEMIEPHVAEYERELGMEGTFVPICTKYAHDVNYEAEGVGPDDLIPFGICTLSRHPIAGKDVRRLCEDSAELPRFDEAKSDMRLAHWAVLRTDIQTQDGVYIIATTHLPKAEEGTDTTDFQRETLKKLLTILRDWREFVLCGDLNAPRGYEIFEVLAQHYRDNIPKHYTTSLDNSIHRAGHKNLQYVVDGLFSSPGYALSDVEYATGLSDHYAIVASIAHAALQNAFTHSTEGQAIAG